MKVAVFKYRIHYLLRQLSVQDYEIALKFLPDLCCVSYPTFKAWIYIKQDEIREIPGTAILKMARFFEVDPEDMYEDKTSFEVNRYKFHELRSKTL